MSTRKREGALLGQIASLDEEAAHKVGLICDDLDFALRELAQQSGEHALEKHKWAEERLALWREIRTLNRKPVNVS